MQLEVAVTIFRELNMAPVCTLCYREFTFKHPLKVPRKLHCGHTFCTECTKKLEDIQGVVLECPVCHHTTLLSPEGIGELERDFEVLGLINKAKQPEICKLCIRKTFPSRPATLYCSDCETSLCGVCSDERHLKQENQMHCVYLASTKDDGMLKVAQDGAGLRSSASLSAKSSNLLSRPSSREGGYSNDSRLSSSLLLDPDQIPDCPEHGEKMRIYCRTDRCLCCSFCEAIGSHKGHDCFQVHEAEEKERGALSRLQDKVEVHSDKFIRARSDVQRMIEKVKKNSLNINDVVRRYFREMRATIDDSEKSFLAELSKRSDANLRALREQLSKMIDISSKAKTASRNCDRALSYDYYEMLTRRKDVEEEMLGILDMMVEIQPVAKANLNCQFPNHESLLNLIKTCPYIVEDPCDYSWGLTKYFNYCKIDNRTRVQLNPNEAGLTKGSCQNDSIKFAAPPPPSEFRCALSEDSCDVILTWNEPESMRYIYPVLHYQIQASIGVGDTFINLCKTNMTSHRISKGDDRVPNGVFVQFQVTAENIIGESKPSRPMGIRIPA